MEAAAAASPVGPVYQVEVPAGLIPGERFRVQIDGTWMVVTCPADACAGSTIQVAPPAPTFATVTGTPVDAGTGNVVGSEAEGGDPNLVHGAAVDIPVVAGVVTGVAPTPDDMHGVQYVEIDEISPAGWICLLVGCFLCPPLNLFGICMRERRLVEVPAGVYAGRNARW